MASGLATSLEVGEIMDCARWGPLPEGEESVDETFDMMGDDGFEAGLLKKGWVLYCLE